MADTKQSPSASKKPSPSKKWKAYVCSDCRALFRFAIPSLKSTPSPKKASSKQTALTAACPHCHSLLKIPNQSSSSQALENPNQKPVHKAPSSTVSSSSSDTPNTPSKQPKRSAQRTNLRRTLILLFSVLSILSLAVVYALGVKFLALREVQSKTSASFIKNHLKPSDLSQKTGFSSLNPNPNEQLRLPIREITRLSNQRILSFVNAPSVNELLSHIHDRKRVEPLLRRYYKKYPYSSAGLHKFVDEKGHVILGDSYLCSIQTNNLLSRFISTIRSKNPKNDQHQFLVDWEHWVGYCELSPKELIEKKPLQPVSLRVTLKQADYYNYAFSNESEWQAYQLQTSYSDDIFYGYVKRDSVEHLQIDQYLPQDSSASSKFYIQAHYPSSHARPSQLIISKVLHFNWLSQATPSP